MEAHLELCEFQNNECPYWTCKEKMPLENIIDHLKDVHEVNLIIEEGEEDSSLTWPVEHEDFTPAIMMFDGHSFLLNCYLKEYTIIFWVTIVGTEEDAQKYEAIMTVESADATKCIKTQGKVYSTEMSKIDVLNGASAEFEIGKKMAKGIGITREDGVLCVEVDYNIFRK